ncbi:MAG: glycosyltransferase family 39 protein, partial [Pseudomonadota bacterium]
HDPWWKGGETYSFGIIYHFFLNHTWLIPTNAGVPFMEKPPLYYWTAVVFCKIFSGVLPLADAARLASVFYTLISMIFLYKTAKLLFADRANSNQLAKTTIALCLACHGFVNYSHTLLTDNALISGTIITLYGLALFIKGNDKPLLSGFWLGLGFGITFMTKGLVMPGILGISSFMLLIFVKEIRNKATLLTAIIAFIAASPFLFIWSSLLYLESPILFHEWFWVNNFGRFFGESVAKLGAKNEPIYFLQILPAFAFPSFPLACIGVFFGRKSLKNHEYLLPLIVSSVGIFILFISASGRAPYILPLMPGFSLLAALLIVEIPEKFATIFTRIIQVGVGVTLPVIWLIWLSLSYPIGSRPLAWLPGLFARFLPYDFVVSEPQYIAVTVAAIVSLLWVILLFYKNNNIARNWLLSFAVLWSVGYSLLMPWVNENRSFRTVLLDLRSFVEKSGEKCITNYNLDENVAPMLHYFTENKIAMPIADFQTTKCNLVLVFSDKSGSLRDQNGWNVVWRGNRFLDLKGSELVLYSVSK